MIENVESIRQQPQSLIRRIPVQTSARAKSPQGQQGQGKNTFLRPWEFDFVGAVSRRIIAEAWFNKDSTKRSEFALFCLRSYQAGAGTDELYWACERVAKERFVDPSSH